MKKNKFLFWSLILFYFVVFIFLLYNSFRYLDPDLGWHLKIGEEIVLNQAVPNLNHHNFTLLGTNWIDHEWLLNALMFLVYNYFGYIVLSAIFALLIVLFLILQLKFLKKHFFPGKSTVFILVFQLLGILAMSPHLGVRVQEVAILGLLILLSIIFDFIKTKNYHVLFWLIPLFFIWSNIHASFLIGIFILFFFISVNAVELYLKKYFTLSFLKNNFSNFKPLFIFGLFSVLATLSTLLTPYGFKIIHLISRINNNSAFHLKYISEWLPVYYLPINYYSLTFAAFIVIALYISIAWGIKKNTTHKINLWYLLLTFLLLYLSFKSKRHFPLFLVVSFPWLVYFREYFLNDSNENLNFIFKNVYIKLLLIITLVLIGISYFLSINFTSQPFSNKKLTANYPLKAIEYLKNSSYKDKRLFNTFGWGGYFIYTWPEKQIFIDGRLPQYPFAGHTILAEYYEFFKEGNARFKLHEHNIESVLLKKPTPTKVNYFEKYILKIDEEKINNFKEYLYDYLETSPEWKKVYDDKISIIYVYDPTI